MPVEEGAAPRFLGQRVQRREDSRFLRGTARFVDDIVLPRMLWASFVRSTEAHATIAGIDSDAALGVGGVRQVVAGAVEDAIRPLTPAHVDRLPLTPERVLGWISARPQPAGPAGAAHR